MYFVLCGSLYQNTVAHSTMSRPSAISTWSSTPSWVARSWAHQCFRLKPPGLNSEGPGASSGCPIASKKALRPAAASSGVSSGTGPV